MKELELIKKLKQHSSLHGETKNIIKGIGDDCAILKPELNSYLSITTDTLVEKIHFDLNFISAYDLGKKTVLANVSDIAAVGGTPLWATLNIAFRNGLNDNFWNDFINGICDTLQEYKISLVGGDTVASSVLTLNLTLIGAVIPEKWLRRDAAKVGDKIYVSGYLGDSAGGLKILNLNNNEKLDIGDSDRNYLIKRHINPSPQLELGKMLSSKGLVACAIDLSDGLATDLSHVCEESCAGAIIFADNIPISRETNNLSKLLRISPLELALKGGEDFELLWTANPSIEDEMLKEATKILGHRPYYVGQITEEKGVFLEQNGQKEEITYQGYEHGSYKTN
jgi:thiamine-monophosphate kinase